MKSIRVLDLTDEGAGLCGQVLADLGANVTLIEPPGGVASRHRGPYAFSRADPEHALGFWAVHGNKHSLVLDLATDAGREHFRQLASEVDVVIESAVDVLTVSHGLDAKSLCAANPQLIGVSITPFGATGPKAHWPATDLTVTAASMALLVTGDADRAPLVSSIPQALLNAGAEAAVHTMVAIYEREQSGLGQHIDISAQTAMMATTQSFCLAAGWNSAQVQRSAGGVRVTDDIHVRFVYRCKDGWVNFTLLFGVAIGPVTRRFFEWMHEEGFCDAATRDKDWINYALQLVNGTEPVSELERIKTCIDSFCLAHTKKELFDEARRRKLLLVPVSDTADLASSEQLKAREFWRQVERNDWPKAAIFPGPFVKLSATPIAHRQPPPLLDSASRSPSRRERAPASMRADAASAMPFAGLKVADFTWVYAGPQITRYLADYGATVVRVETSHRMDALRGGGPFKNGEPGLERSGNYGNVNTNKLGLDINLAVPAGQALAKKLIGWADVVAENYTPRVMKSFDLDWPKVHAINPRAVMLSSCLAGQTGPHADLTGYGTMGAALAGFGYLTGWPDRPPTGPFVAYSDYVSPRLACAALICALLHQRATGKGQYIDVSQSEASMHFMSEALLEYTTTGRVPGANGNRHSLHAPSGVYPVTGKDSWIAIAAPDEAAWQALCTVSRCGWEHDERFRTIDARRNNADALDAAVGAWSRDQAGPALMQALNGAGVPAHIASSSADLFEDPQLMHRRHFVTLTHPQWGEAPWENSRAILSRTPAHVRATAPMYGQHNELVLRELLGLDDDAIAELVAAGAVG